MKLSRDEFIRRFPNASEAVIRASCEPDGVASCPVLEQDSSHESVAADARKAPHQVRRLVRYTCFRVRTIDDQENPCTKFFTDALVAAGFIVDDSREWCQIEIEHVDVKRLSEERTLIQIYDT